MRTKSDDIVRIFIATLISSILLSPQLSTPVSAKNKNSASPSEPVKLAKEAPPTAPQRGPLQTGTESTSLHTGTQSTSLQTGTQSTTLQTGTQSTTLQTGTQSTTLQTGTQSTTIQGGTQGAMIQGGVEDASGPMNVLILLDASYSMKEKITGEQKMACAKRVLQNTMARIPNDINVGLRVFGNYGGSPEMDCRASTLLVPIGTGNRATLMSKVHEIEAFGMTPLTYALMCAADDDFRGVVGRKVIVLISDGVDTCGQDPCRFISMLPHYGIKIKIDVVGVDIKKDPGARRQLNCIAETSGGKYYDASTAGQLIESVSASVDKAISGHVIIPSKNAKNTETPPELIPMHATPDRP